MTDVRPIIFGKHCLLERISVGGMAEVFRARPFNAPGFSRFLALKRILPNLAADEEFISMFVDEAKIAVQLNHRAVCQIYELGRLDGSFYIVMEYIAGKDVLALQNWFRKRRKIMSVAQAAYIAAEVCDGLDYAHRKQDDNGQPLNIIHRDISPQNVLVSYDGDVKLIDFGIARAATTNQQTQVGVLKGKFGYMSPEQVDAKPLDHRSDIFAVGTLLWEMLTARRLFYGESDFATLEKVRAADIQPPSARNPRVPEEIDRIVMRALTRDRDERYQWASEMARDLRAFLRAASPNYGDQRLSAWMVKNFPNEISEERAKVPLFERFVTVDDVFAYYTENPQLNGVAAAPDVVDEEDATQVYDPTAHALDEVLAASALDPLPTLVGDETGAAAPPDPGLRLEGGDLSLDADPMADLAVPQRTLRPTDDLPPVRRSGGVGAGVWIALVLVLAAAGAGAWFFGFAPDPSGSLVIASTPSAGVEVYVDGVLQEGEPPITLPALTPGEHAIELRLEGYEPIADRVAITAGSRTEIARTLSEVRVADGQVALSLSDPRAQVYLDGNIVGGQGGTRAFPVAAGEPHVVEVYLPEHFVERYELDLAEGGRFERTVTLRPVTATITVRSDPAGTVYLDGERAGDVREGVTTIAGLDIRDTYELEIRPDSPSFRTYTTTVVFDTYYDLQLRPRLSRRGTATTDEAVAFGYLATGPSTPWMQVFVDGRDTGLVTPISEERPLALKVGERAVTFVRPGVERATSVTIVEDETVRVEVPE